MRNLLIQSIMVSVEVITSAKTPDDVADIQMPRRFRYPHLLLRGTQLLFVSSIHACPCPWLSKHSPLLPFCLVPGAFTISQANKAQTVFAHELWTRIRLEFPELRIYRVWDRPVGPHPIAMFEVNIFTPAQFGAFIAWLVINRGPLSVLVHPNTGDDEVSNILGIQPL